MGEFLKVKGFSQFILFSLSVMVLIYPVSIAYGVDLFQASHSVRALGMGNIYAPIVRDSDSMFYNPAGLAQVEGINWTIFNLFAGANGVKAFNKLQDLKDSDTFSKIIKKMYGERVWAAGGGNLAITLPYFGFAIYNHIDVSLDVNNPAYTNMDISVTNDVGQALGVGLPIGPMFHVGAVVRRITRIGARAPFGPSFIASLDPNSISDDIKTKGIGFAADIGINIKPSSSVSPTFSFVWYNIGGTSFIADKGSKELPSDEEDMALGMALDIDAGLVSITPALEIKHLNHTDEQLGKKIHLGVELGLPLMDIRAGFYQGYYTLGAGLSLGFLRIDAATYGVEIGEYQGQLEDRRYIAQLTLEIGFDMGLRFLGSGEGGSMWRRKKLKRRR